MISLCALSAAILLSGVGPTFAQPPAATASPPATPAPVADLPAPGGLGDDPTVWPNGASFRNSDDWLWQNHDHLREMRPRVLVLNFANDADEPSVRAHSEGVVKAFAEATRYHGYSDAAAKAFVQYQVVKLIDLRDDAARTEPARKTSSRMPVKKDGGPGEPVLDYGALFSDEFAPHLGFEDPRTPGRFLNLIELVNAGWVHELWFYAIHDAGDRWPGNETCEFKQHYDDDCRPIAGKYGPAGNGHDRSMPWIGRSFRIAFFNPHRGPGCSMENFGHTMEWIANSQCIPYYHRYFYEFAAFDLDKRHALPFGSFYRTSYTRESGDKMDYPKPDRLEVQYRGETHVVEPFILAGGSAHFPPGARWHYDLESPYTVLTTLETYRTRKAPGDTDEAREFSREKFRRYKDVAPDCMGQWIVYWFQSMPGLDNTCTDAAGRPMKNWWPFLFY